MDRASRPPRVVRAGAGHREFVRRLSAEVFARFGDYEMILPRMMGWPWIHTYVAEMDGRPVGFAMLSLEDLAAGETELTAIAVGRRWQRAGVGRALLSHAESETLRLAPRGGPASVRLTVAEDNERARGVFERAGFRPIPGLEESYPAGQPSLVMHKPLRAPGLDSGPPGSKVD